VNESPGLTPSSPDREIGRYDLLARLLHWVFAIGIIYASIVGYSLGFIGDHQLHDALAHLNMSLATILLVLLPVRLLWRFRRIEPPQLAMDARQQKIAQLVHALLYFTMAWVLVSGFLMVAHSYSFFGLFDIPTVFEAGGATHVFFQLHRVGCALLAGLVGLHLLGVIKHLVIHRTNILRRML